MCRELFTARVASQTAAVHFLEISVTTAARTDYEVEARSPSSDARGSVVREL